jgi:hypothetical protein
VKLEEHLVLELTIRFELSVLKRWVQLGLAGLSWLIRELECKFFSTHNLDDELGLQLEVEFCKIS